ncbi:hypothetical protein SPF06_03030 [Sinomonas sp. JGH33]|uniref:Lipoprotein n=1 Tax=Sinomonas terricola TaxID=3110330 RepID=A0ABU5T2J1_9MICC|nr:hypothetical protein [Sinomonas sp. JGH33]MEA5453686.1 hypothetical protein [Sinomonas sp. JGH33]
MLRRHRVAAAILAVISLAGCGSNVAQTRPSGKIAGSFEELLDFKLSRSDINDFERDVYKRAKETGRIAQADYDEAYARYADCMSERGYPVTLKKLPNGSAEAA